MKNDIYAIENGAAVKGDYLGVPYSGIVREQRQHTMNHRIRVFSVDLDAPIVVFGMSRDSLMVNASNDLSALSQYLGHAADAVAIEKVAR